MTPEIELIDKEIAALQDKRTALIQAHLATIAVAQVGELITWGEQGRKGRVLFFQNWGISGVGYRVRGIKKDGTEGELATVYPYVKPTRIES